MSGFILGVETGRLDMGLLLSDSLGEPQYAMLCRQLDTCRWTGLASEPAYTLCRRFGALLMPCPHPEHSLCRFRCGAQMPSALNG